MTKWWRSLSLGVVALIGFVGIAYVVLKLAPDWFSETEGLDANGQSDARQGVRTASLALLAGALAVIGSVYTARTFGLNRAGQLTDRFTKAIEQLGHEKLDVRLGGIYALERIARDSKDDHPQIVEVLTAYVREHAPRNQARGHGLTSASGADDLQQAGSQSADDSSASTPPQIPATDVQAALSVLGRRRLAHERAARPQLHMALTHLRGANLRGATLRGADLRATDLREADLREANFAAASLDEADLGKADVRWASLSGARLVGADLREADLGEADLGEANFNDARLGEADLGQADLRGASLRGADLRGASLRRADLRATDLREAILCGADLHEANFSRTTHTTINRGPTRVRATTSQWTEFHGANLSGADLGDTDLRQAHLDGVQYDDRTRWPPEFDQEAAGARQQDDLGGNPVPRR